MQCLLCVVFGWGGGGTPSSLALGWGMGLRGSMSQTGAVCMERFGRHGEDEGAGNVLRSILRPDDPLWSIRGAKFRVPSVRRARGSSASPALRRKQHQFLSSFSHPERWWQQNLGPASQKSQISTPPGPMGSLVGSPGGFRPSWESKDCAQGVPSRPNATAKWGTT